MPKNNKKYIQAPTTEDLERIENGEKFSDITASTIKKALDNDLSETMGSFDETLLGNKSATKKPKKFRRSMYFSLGIFVTVMSFVGMIFTVNAGVNLVKRIADNTSQKNEFAQYIFPAVIVDAPVFEEGASLPVEVMLTAAVWDIITGEDKDKYSQNLGIMTVPASDVEVHATKLFGSGLKFGHQSLGDPQNPFIYDESANSYQIPASPQFLPYSPKVEDIKKLSENKFELMVGYYPPVRAWLPEGTEPIPDKHMKYTLIKNGKNYNIISIQSYYDTAPMS